MKRVRIIEDPKTHTVTIIKDEIKAPEYLSAETIEELETQGDLMVANALQKYQKNGFWKIIVKE